MSSIVLVWKGSCWPREWDGLPRSPRRSSKDCSNWSQVIPGNCTIHFLHLDRRVVGAGAQRADRPAGFYSPTYRNRYAEFLKIDFPRLPLTSNVELFRALCVHGPTLSRSPSAEKSCQRGNGFPGPG